MNKFLRKIGLVLILVLLLAWPVVAEVTFGVRAGGAYSALIQNRNDTYNVGARFGFSVAGLVDVPIYKGLSVRSEIAFANQGGAYSTQLGWMRSESLIGFQLESERKYSYYALQIPVNLAYTFVFTDVRLSVFAGPTFDFPLFGRMSEGGIAHHLQFGNDKTDDLKSFNLGVNLGLGVEYSRFFFSINSIGGTSDSRAVKTDGESSVYQNNVVLSLGYFFRSH